MTWIAVVEATRRGGDNCSSNQQVVVIGDLKATMLNHESKELWEHLIWCSHIPILAFGNAEFVNKSFFSCFVCSFFPIPLC
jgi:hypothetical protein